MATLFRNTLRFMNKEVIIWALPAAVLYATIFFIALIAR